MGYKKAPENEKKNDDKIDHTNNEKLTKRAEIENDNINRILHNIDEQLVSSIQSEKAVSTDNISDKAEDSSSYQNAFTLLKTTYQGNKNFDIARSAFTKFIDTHPKSMMLGNAYYWLAETYMYDKNYNNAAIQYLKGYQAPHNERTLDNLMGLSKALFQLGKYQQVCSTIVQIAKEKDKPTISMQQNIEKLAAKSGCKS